MYIFFTIYTYHPPHPAYGILGLSSRCFLYGLKSKFGIQSFTVCSAQMLSPDKLPGLHHPNITINRD
jgi:hypothetical protein